jgi:Domain of Unknown Function (DUF1206)
MGNTAQAKGQQARATARQATGWLDGDTATKVGRFGVAGLGVVYLLLAWLSAQLAFGGSDQSADNTGALKELAGNGPGKVLLVVLAVAFAAYAVWQLYEAAAGFHHYSGKKRTAKRAGAVVKAAIGAALAVSSARLVAGSGQKDSSEQQQDLTARLLGEPGGKALVIVIGLAVVAFSAYLAYRGWTREFLEKLEGRPSHRVELLGVAGYVARGVVFGVLGILVVVAGFRESAEQARGLDAALKTLSSQSYGPWLLGLIALGIAAYGVYCFFQAKYRKV